MVVTINFPTLIKKSDFKSFWQPFSYISIKLKHLKQSDHLFKYRTAVKQKILRDSEIQKKDPDCLRPFIEDSQNER